MSYEKLGFTKGQVLKADHLNHIEEGIAKAGAPYTEPAPMVEIVTRPYVEGDDILNLNGFMAYKISDLIPSVDDIIGGTLYAATQDGEVLFNRQIDHSLIQEGNGFYSVWSSLFIVVQSCEIGIDDYTTTAPSTGVYMAVEYPAESTAKMTYYSKPVTKIHKDWLPSVGVTKFYTSDNYDGECLYTSPNFSEGNEVDSKTLEDAIDNGTIAICGIDEDGILRDISYPTFIFTGSKGYMIVVAGYNVQYGYYTSDYEAGVS